MRDARQEQKSNPLPKAASTAALVPMDPPAAPVTLYREPTKDLTDQDSLNFAGRWIENARTIGAIPRASYLAARHQQQTEEYFLDSDNANFEAQTATIIGYSGGLLTGIILHYLLKKYYKKASSDNPLYRTFKTLAAVGAAFGTTVSRMVPLPPLAQNILADVASIGIGLISFPYWYFREKYFRKYPVPKEERNKLTKTGLESWSKYGKTFLVFGASFGQVLGAVHSHFTSRNLLANMAIFGGITSLGSFAVGMSLVPLFSWVKQKRNKKRIEKRLRETKYLTEKSTPTEINEAINAYHKLEEWDLIAKTSPNETIKAEILKFFEIKKRLQEIKVITADSTTYQSNEAINAYNRLIKTGAISVDSCAEVIDEQIRDYIFLKESGKIKEQTKPKNKDSFRNNYVRTGILLGAALGTTVGFILGTLVFPGVGSAIGMTLGGAIGGIAGGTVLGITGERISKHTKKRWGVGEDTDNSWDYATRSMYYTGAFLGAAIGFFVPVPGGALVGAAIGGAMGGLAGWVGGLGVVRAARRNNNPELPAKTLPWSQRMGTGGNVGSLVCSGIGFLLGLAGGPMGAIIGATLGYSFGGFIGSLLGVAYEKIKQPTKKPMPQQESPIILAQDETSPAVPEPTITKSTAIPIPGAQADSPSDTATADYSPRLLEIGSPSFSPSALKLTADEDASTMTDDKSISPTPGLRSLPISIPKALDQQKRPSLQAEDPLIANPGLRLVRSKSVSSSVKSHSFFNKKVAPTAARSLPEQEFNRHVIRA
ncbi:MAG: hypothetical protein ACYCQI_01900 [Gammaproteobacteria bacterium]